jgi:CubicO group peptidase (beta-lactamase class C family)
VRAEIHAHAQAVLSQELKRVRRLSPEERARVEGVSATVVAAAVEQILEEAGGEPRLAAALASIYRPEQTARTTLATWPVEAVRRA